MVEVMQQGDGGVVLRLPPVVDIFTAAPLRSCIRQLLNSGHRTLHLDMREVTFIDADGVSLLAEAERRANELDGHLDLVDLRPQIRRVLDLAGMEALGRRVEDGRLTLPPPSDAA